MKHDTYIVIAKREDGSFVSDVFDTETPRSDFNACYRHQSYEIIAVIPSPVNELEKITTNRFKVETLKTRNSDDLDFHKVSVWGLSQALRDAYALGYKAALAESEGVKET